MATEDDPNKRLLDTFKRKGPGITPGTILPGVKPVKPATADPLDSKSAPTNTDVPGTQSSPSTSAIDNLAAQFAGTNFEKFGTFKSHFNSDKNTFKKLVEASGNTLTRPDEPPPVTESWELRLGGSKFFVPPININVSKAFKAGSLGGALRQPSTPKFNSGHSETLIQMTLFFPTHENIWGFEGDHIDLDFDKGSKEDIDYYLASLRGLVTAFRYSPILPVKNEYLNRVHDVTGVGLQSLNVSTLENFPYCLVATLTLVKFNHKVYLPMVKDFNAAIHWGRYRQYIGRAAAKLNEISSKDFLKAPPTPDKFQQTPNPFITAETVLNQLDSLETKYGAAVPFNKTEDILNGKDFDLFYPYQDPAEVITDNRTVDDFLKKSDPSKRHDWWQSLLSAWGVNVDTDPGAVYDTAKHNSEDFGKTYHPTRLDILKFNRDNNILVQQMTSAELDKYVASVLSTKEWKDASPEKRKAKEAEIRQTWWALAFDQFFASPYTQAALERQNYKNDNIFISEWEVPMAQLNLDPDQVFVQSVGVNINNNFARLTIQMQDDPTLQHLGAGDTTCDVSLIVIGESELTKIREMFDIISGLARLEHSHGVLGFLGIKNLVTALVGFKYAIPSAFEVDTMPNHPHVYQVRLSFMDFDVFQSRRESLSLDQQAELVDAFGKANPFLRIKQLYGAFSAYNDFPLALRDDKDRVIGHLDPDFYFRAWEAVADDFHQDEDPAVASSDSPQDKILSVYTGAHGGDDHSTISLDKDRMSFYNGKELVGSASLNEPMVDNVGLDAQIEGMTPPSKHTNASLDKTGNPMVNAKSMARDEQYRSKDGRMIKAFPTYMLWFVQESGNLAGVKLYDNFYGLQSVTDLSIVRSEDVLGDTMVIRISNLFSRLSKDSQFLFDEALNRNAQIFNTALTREINAVSGTTNLLVKLDSVKIKPGGRVHLRLGFSSDPNSLETVFNGVITSVEMGEVIELVCQSDAIELGNLVNSHNTKTDSGSSGRIDGSMSGWWLSQPRDLMISLLTIGSGVAKQAIAHATRGHVFSENKFGIKHFGMMLYGPLSAGEKAIEQKKRDYLANNMHSTDDSVAAKTAGLGSLGRLIGGVLGLYDTSILGIAEQLWIGYNARADYEIFKRNIYPGNGLGVSQYLGGDIGDYGLNKALAATGVNADGTLQTDSIPGVTGTLHDPVAGSLANSEAQTRLQSGPPELSKNVAINDAATAYNPQTGLQNLSNFAREIGIFNRRSSGGDGPADEICFRAQTYMKTVWDLFQICAALLPNYIVAVRPFENRSTIFYGKPHWAYTSGVIPVTEGPSNADLTPDDPDAEYQDLFNKLQDAIIARDSKELIKPDPANQATNELINGHNSDPLGTVGALKYGGDLGDPKALPSSLPNGAALINTQGPVVMEMHLPTDPSLELDTKKHQQIAELPPELRHPFYMDRVGGGVGGVDTTNKTVTGPNQTVLKHDDPLLPGKPGAFGFLDPESEKWYINQHWVRDAGYKGTHAALKDKKILIFYPGPKNDINKAVVCTPGDVGPANSKLTGISPDTNWALGGPGDGKHTCYFGFVRDETPLGPYQGKLSDIMIGNTAPIPTDTGPTAPAPYQGPLLPGQISAKPTKGFDWLPAGKDANDYSIRYGYWADKTAIPVNFSRNPDDPSYDHDIGLPIDQKDIVGGGAEAVYKDSDVSNTQANEIWNEFRTNFDSDPHNQENFNNFADDPANPNPPSKSEKDKIYHQTIINFRRDMWQDPYRRGWIVLTASKVGTVTDTAQSLGNIAGGPIVGDTLSGGVRAVDNTANLISRNNPFSDDNGGHPGPKWTFGAAEDAFAEYLRSGGDSNALNSYLHQHDQPGSRTGNIVAKTLQKFKSDFIDPILDFLKATGTFVFGTIGTIISTLRLSMMQLTGGLSMVSMMQKRTNVLSDLLNDSVYFQGDPSTLAYLVDNPFTREYGEPVVEIREPFQRSHFISSFQNIISNNIIENQDGVATVVTAISNGNYPHTVYFDKGAPAEYQKEKVVETGLIIDTPGGVWDTITSTLTFMTNFAPERRLKKIASGAPDELSAKRVALYHLKESLKDIYTGEILITGDATMRPHDLLYISDIFSKIFGMCEIEQVVHHFTPETGFITAITPNALVSVNDPGRFYFSAVRDAVRQRTGIRQALQHSLKVQADGSGSLDFGQKQYSINDLAKKIAPVVEGSTQYIGGISGLIKPLAGMASVGGMATVGTETAIGAPAVAPLIPVAAVGGFFAWKAWKWTRDNLLDQHDVIIQYLRRNGQPMDAGLVMNQSVAVGQQHGLALMLGGINLGRLSTKVGNSGLISTEELLTNLGYREKGIGELFTSLSSYVEDANEKILAASGRAPDRLPGVSNQVLWAHVDKVEDGDTFYVTVIDGTQGVASAGAKLTIRPAAYDAPEDPHKTHPQDRYLYPNQPGVIASLYAISKIEGKDVAIRIDPISEQDKYQRVLGFTFCNARHGMEGDERKAYLVQAAGGFPVVDWDSYNEDGEPYTLDKEMLQKGYAVSSASLLLKNKVPNSGAELGG